MRWRWLVLAVVFLPLMVGAETISWTNPTTFTDGTTIPAGTSLTTYLRGWKDGSTAKTYFGETRNSATSWSDNVMVKMNQWGVQNSVPGWVAIKPGDVVWVSASTAYVASDGNEYDSAESAPIRWTIPGATPPPPPPPPPPVIPPACTPPKNVTIR